MGHLPRIIVECDSARLDLPLFSSRLIRIPPSAVSGSSAPCRWSGRPRLPGRHSSVTASPLRCRTGLSVGRSTSGRPPPGALGWLFCPQAHAGHVGRLVGTATPLREHWRPGQYFAPQLTYHGSSWEQKSHLPCTPTCRLRQRQSYRLTVVMRTVGSNPTAKWTVRARG